MLMFMLSGCKGSENRAKHKIKVIKIHEIIFLQNQGEKYPLKKYDFGHIIWRVAKNCVPLHCN